MTTARVMRFFIAAARTFFTREAPLSYARKPAWMSIMIAMLIQ
jgi:hypothetical protein